jgi:hypothetical protein
MYKVYQNLMMFLKYCYVRKMNMKTIELIWYNYHTGSTGITFFAECLFCLSMYKFVHLSMYKKLSTTPTPETSRQEKSIEREKNVAESILMNITIFLTRA